MLDWLTHDWHLFGLTGQLWMPVIVMALIIYLVVLSIVRRRSGRTH